MSNVINTATTTNNNAAKAAKVANTVQTAKQAIAAPTVKHGSLKYRLLSEIASASAAIKALCRNTLMFDEITELDYALSVVARANGKEHNKLPLLGLTLVQSGHLSEGKYTKYLALFGATKLNGANVVERFQAVTKRSNTALKTSFERKLKSDDPKVVNAAAANLQALTDLNSDFKTALADWQAAQK